MDSSGLYILGRYINDSLGARANMKTILMDLIIEKRVALERNGASPRQDLIACLLCIRNEDN
ncbi:hypothetical protein ACSBR1_015204 [Camellia fascicularis]